MKFLLTNDGGFRNKGNEAITKSLINGITSLKPDSFFEVFTSDPLYGANMVRTKNVSFLLEPFRPWFSFSRWWQYLIVSKLRLAKVSAPNRNAMQAFGSCDVVLSVAADSFCSTYGALDRELAFIQTGLAFRKPVILIDSSIGPFESKKEHNAFAKLAKKTRLITVRESVSLNRLQSMDLKNTKIELAADPAFCLEPDLENIEEIWKMYNFPINKKLVGIAPSQGITSYSNTSFLDHLKALQTLATFLIKDLDFHVVLIPHVHSRDIASDDRVLCEKIYRVLNFSENITIVNFGHTAEETKAIISKMDLLVAERMHAAIAALSQNVPTFAVGYSVKYEGILGDIFGFENLGDYLIRVENLTGENLKLRVNNLLSKRKEVKQHLSNIMPGVKESAQRNFSLIVDVTC